MSIFLTLYSIEYSPLGDCMLKEICVEPSRVFEGRKLDVILQYEVVTLKAREIILWCLEENGKKNTCNIF